ncbi:MAG TPA: metallophosphoesterase [Phycisphaerae bacterium]|nr:metallophosphoesterase [Phycisphaerae bacterium]HOM50598.1 metallophosphoesterase [Phycisphaerae bacterium]HON65107.1 metallophosphoesterase [Phycisphaerae bacterium]HOQ87096.1 metallophosphoesterase [Phycisphaerae bacterium]HPU25619.1 metallophosphoesterase [Phycisphaerae bacterium]
MNDKHTEGYRHQRLRTGVLATACVVAGWLLALRGGYLDLPMPAVFPLLLLLIAMPTVFWWAWVDEWLAGRRRVNPEPARSDDQAGAASRRSRVTWARLLMAAYTAAMLAPIVMLMCRWRGYEALPVPAIMWLLIWHITIALAAVMGLVLWIPWRITRGLRSIMRVNASSEAAPNNADDDASDAVRMNRRAILTGALAGVPMLLTGGTVAAGVNQQGRFTVRRIDLPLARLPDRLRGLTITHLSDFHVGRMFRPEHLGRVVEAVNQLDSDIVAITGDIVDHSADHLPAACDAFAEMRQRYGRFVVAGNHDLIDSPREAVAYLARREPHFLVDHCVELDIGGERVRIAGLFWSRYDRARFGSPGHYERVASTLPANGSAITSAAELFTIALAHHPHAFDPLAEAGADLTLAGHTHGGQLMATPQGSKHPIGGGSLLFRYIWGVYRRGHAALYVNSGVGNWFPVRINAPAEIVQIRLV